MKIEKNRKGAAGGAKGNGKEKQYTAPSDCAENLQRILFCKKKTNNNNKKKRKKRSK